MNAESEILGLARTKVLDSNGYMSSPWLRYFTLLAQIWAMDLQTLSEMLGSAGVSAAKLAELAELKALMGTLQSPGQESSDNCNVLRDLSEAQSKAYDSVQLFPSLPFGGSGKPMELVPAGGHSHDVLNYVRARGIALTSGEWDDSQQNALGLRDTGANIPVLTQYGATAIYLPKFDVDDRAIFCIQLPHSLQLDSTVIISPHVHWFASSDSSNVVRWELSYQWVNHNGTIGSDAVIEIDDTPVADRHSIIAFQDVSKASGGISSLFMGSIRRITNEATDYAGDVFMAFFDLHFKKDTHGSNNVTTKTWPARHT
jgi:hypothetical protein